MWVFKKESSSIIGDPALLWEIQGKVKQGEGCRSGKGSEQSVNVTNLFQVII
jgi:hypothetical protein